MWHKGVFGCGNIQSNALYFAQTVDSDKAVALCCENKIDLPGIKMGGGK